MSDSLTINEIYLSLQGESTFAGLPCVFIRLTACNLRCSYCDTAYAFTQGRKMTLAEITARVHELAAPYQPSQTAASNAQLQNSAFIIPHSSFPIQHSRLPLVELTGGEPLLQKNSLPLMKSLCDAGYTVLLETSGALDIAPVDPRVHRIMDLKCPGSGEVRRNRWQNLSLLKAGDEIKFVIGTAQDYEWAREQLTARRLAEICPVLFSWVSPLQPHQQGQVVAKSSRRPNRPHPAPTRREDHRRRPSRPLSTANAQIHLAARTSGASDMTRAQKILSLLRDYESPNILAIAPDLSAPTVWERAGGVHVWDAEGRKYLDLTAAFGVAAAGHANPPRRRGGAAADGRAPPRHGRRLSPRRQGRTGPRTQPPLPSNAGPRPPKRTRA